ncbi:MAG TPA: FecR domain-containing protein [Gemmatimonadaceae bacterium]|nr:FecR domain-containing protein [Gemmatimonadaceae bacterium]
MNMSIADDSSAHISPDDWERIARYVTGEAGASEAEATRRWIEADPHRVDVVRLLDSILANVARDDTADVNVESALASVKTRMREPKVLPFAPRPADHGRSRRTTYAFLRAAAAVIIIVGGVMMWENVRRSRLESSEQTFATNVGERRQILLKDGTKVLLGPTTRLVVAASTDDGQRFVTLDGIAYFNVVHDPAHPFTVRAGSISIQDIGTAFAVENDDSAGTKVAVDSGSVAIGAADQNRVRGAVLNARDRASVDTQGTVSVERSAVSEDDLAWTQGRLVFRDAALVLVGAELYRWYGVRLRVADSSLVKLHLTASFSGEPIDRVLNVIALSLGARVERQGNVAVLSRASEPAARP